MAQAATRSKGTPRRTAASAANLRAARERDEVVTPTLTGRVKLTSASATPRATTTGQCAKVAVMADVDPSTAERSALKDLLPVTSSPAVREASTRTPAA